MKRQNTRRGHLQYTLLAYLFCMCVSWGDGSRFEVDNLLKLRFACVFIWQLWVYIALFLYQSLVSFQLYPFFTLLLYIISFSAKLTHSQISFSHLLCRTVSLILLFLRLLLALLSSFLLFLPLITHVPLFICPSASPLNSLCLFCLVLIKCNFMNPAISWITSTQRGTWREMLMFSMNL